MALPLVGNQTSTYSHDDNGNLSVDAAGYAYSYDHRNRLTEITNIAQYGYDALGRRIKKYDDDKDLTTYFYYDPFGRVIAEYEEPDSGSEEFARSFVYGNGIDEVLAMFLPERDYDPNDVDKLMDFCDTWLADSGDGNYNSDFDYDDSGVVDFNDFAVLADDSWSLPQVNETRFYYLHDALGSVIGIVGGKFQREDDREFYLYDVYGTPSETSDCGNPYLFTGRRLDEESGLYYFRFRTYDSYTGRMLQTDPIGYYDSMNLYEYVTSNPTNWVDPYGLFERLSDARPWWKTGWNWLRPGDYFSRDNLREMLEQRRKQNEFDEAYRQAQRKIAERRDNLKECLECIEIGQDLQIAIVMGTAQGVANVANGLQDSAIGLVNTVIWIGNSGHGTVPMATPRTTTPGNQVQLKYVDSRDWSYGLFVDESRLGHEVSKIVGAESVEFLAGVGMAKAFLVVKKGRNAKQVADCLQDAAEEVSESLTQGDGTSGTGWNYDDGGYATDPYGPWDVGSGSEELNGTFDMMGNVWEWMESPWRGGHYLGSNRGFRGGSYGSDYDDLSSFNRGYDNPLGEVTVRGFRVASVPEPTTLLLLGMGGLMLRRKR